VPKKSNIEYQVTVPIIAVSPASHPAIPARTIAMRICQWSLGNFKGPDFSGLE
jgi:hypothetical protein